MEDDKETAELQSMMEVILDEEEVAVDAIPLATKPPSIVDWKIIKEGKTSYYQIIRADRNLKRPEEGYERVLWGDLKNNGFEHNCRRYRCGEYTFEKRYLLTPATITEMLNNKLQTDHLNEICYQLLNLMTKQLKKQ
ncbi:hypothetical protein Tco_1546778 [Tanacetum coccineum]